MEKDGGGKCRTIKTGHSWLFQITLGKDWKKFRTKIGWFWIILDPFVVKIKIEHSKSFWTTLVGKDWEKCEMTKIGCSEWFYTTLVGKDWKMLKWQKLGILNLLDHFGGKRIGKSVKWSNWAFQIILDHFVEKDWERCKTTKIGCSNKFTRLIVCKWAHHWACLVGH